MAAFRIEVDLPQFSAAVNSGGGLHIYWISDKPMDPAAWVPYARGSRRAAARGVKCDAGLTTDDVRLLRLPGTFNHKYDPPREVKLLPAPLAEYNFATTMSFLRRVTRSPASPTVTSRKSTPRLSQARSLPPHYARSRRAGLGAGVERCERHQARPEADL